MSEYPAPNLKIGTHWLRIGSAGEEGWVVNSCLVQQRGGLHAEGPSQFPLSPDLGPGTYVMLMGNATLDSVDLGISFNLLHSEITPLGGAWPPHDTAWYKVVVGPGELWTQFGYTKIEQLPGGFDAFFGVWKIIVDTPVAVLPMKMLENEEQNIIPNNLYAQSSSGAWVPPLQPGPYEVDVSFTMSYP